MGARATCKENLSDGREFRHRPRDRETVGRTGYEVLGNVARYRADLARLHRVKLDLADLSSITHAFEAARHEAGGVDVVINNAGGGHFDAAELKIRS